MIRFATFKTAVLSGMTLVMCGCGPVSQRDGCGYPERIVTLSPGVTEIVCALGLGGKLVGDTEWCSYPQEAEVAPKVGGFGHINREAVFALNPDMVIVPSEMFSEAEAFRRLGLDTLVVDTGSLDGIFATIRSVGEACGAQDEALSLEKAMKERIGAAGGGGSGKRPRVLLLFGVSGRPLQAFGRSCLHNELLELAGGENVVTARLPFVRLSEEAVKRLHPDMVIRLAPGTVPAKGGDDCYSDCVLTGEYTCIPGPRLVDVIDDIAGCINKWREENH